MFRCVRMALFSLFAAALLFAASTWDGAGSAVHAQATTQSQLYGLNTLRRMTVANWESQYNVLRRQVVHNWVDWSQDGCSAPWIATALAEITTSVADYNEVFHYGCLRHDMMWRTLPIVDGGTGRIWNERNRVVADEKFRSDNNDTCYVDYPWAHDLQGWAYCYAASWGYFKAVRGYKYDKDLTPAEESHRQIHSGFDYYPSSTHTVDCSLLSSRCLPVHYITVSGRPLVPQNIPYIAYGRTVPVQLVRANLRYPDGAPSPSDVGPQDPASEWKNDGHVALRVMYPLRASLTSTVTCPSSPLAHETFYISPGTNPLGVNDSLRKSTLVYIRACRATTEAERDNALLEIFPREAVHLWQNNAAQAIHRNAGARVRHYENFRARSCHAMIAEFPFDIVRSWLATDCMSTQSTGGYADYYTFTVPIEQTIQIDLSYADQYVDTYLYLLEGNGTNGTFVTDDDDSGTGGNGRNSRISRTLDDGIYTVVATTYSRDLLTGDYRLRVQGSATTPAATPAPAATPGPTGTPPPSNASPPTVSAGDDQTVSPRANVSVSGTGSPVDDDDDMTYAWAQTSGTTVSMLKGTSSAAYVPNVAGSDSFKFVAPSSSATLVFQLTVTDLGTNLTASDTMTVTVR